jgi:hypothetical protein
MEVVLVLSMIPLSSVSMIALPKARKILETAGG